jgi:hypothetical protein
MSKSSDGLTTLSGIYKEARMNKANPMTEEEIKGINIRLLLLVQLSSLQRNVAWEIEQIFKKHGMFNFRIKHNHKRIVELIKGSGNDSFWNQLTQEQIQDIGDDADTIEDVIYRLVGLRKDDE